MDPDLEASRLRIQLGSFWQRSHADVTCSASSRSGRLSSEEQPGIGLDEMQDGSPEPWVALVRAIAGCSFNKQDRTAQVLRRRMSRVLNDTTRRFVIGHLDTNSDVASSDLDRIARFLTSLAAILATRPSIHMSNLIEKLATDGVFPAGSVSSSVDARNQQSLQKLIFIAVGWITNLYIPDLAKLDEPFAIDSEGATYIQGSVANLDPLHRPIVETIRELGDLLPRSCNNGDGIPSRGGVPSVHRAPPNPDLLHVASLNINTLIGVGKIKIEWTETLSSHLDFNTADLDHIRGTITPVLKLFKFPSLCYQHAPPSSVLQGYSCSVPSSIFSFWVLQDWFDNDDKPNGFTVKSLMQEILHSYKLLVLFDKRARKKFCSITNNASKQGDYDLELDRLCLGGRRGRLSRLGFMQRPDSLRETFQAHSDFPIFSSRLLKLEEYIDSVQPNRVSSLWRDRRDILRWYTFWAVFFLGSLNIFFALTQTALSSEQVRLAQLALKQAPA